MNLASRLQNLNKEMGTDVILSNTTKAKLAASLALKPLPPQRVRGRAKVSRFTRLLLDDFGAFALPAPPHFSLQVRSLQSIDEGFFFS